MLYDYNDKIGNQGDVVKHAALVEAVRWALAQKAQTPFLYAESHAGRPEYVLTENGSWKFGIQAFFEGFQKASEADRLPLETYAEQFVGGPVRCGKKYMGSSGIAFQMIKEELEFHYLMLHETAPGAWGDLRRYFCAFPCVQVLQRDGLAGLRVLSSGSLVLIDPPDLSSARDVQETMDHLARRNIPFVAWTPRNAGRFDDGWREGSPSSAFYDHTSRFSRARVRWAEWNSQGIKGCQITCSTELESVVSPIAEAIRNIMMWSEA